MKLCSSICDRRYLYQYLATLTGSFSVITSGINLGWTSPYLPQILNGTYPDIIMDSNEGSWCAIMPLLGGPPGAILTALVVDKMGRKYTTLVMAPLTFIMFILLAFAKTIWLICLARFIIGSVEAGLYTVLPIYYGEISHPSIRGLLTASIGIAAIIGMLVINVIGIYYSIFTSSLICSLIPVIHFLTFMYMPESPYYSIKKGKIDEAEKNLQILRGCSDVEEEMKALREAIIRQEGTEKAKFTDLFTVESNRRGVFIFVILNFAKKFSGKNPLLFYTVMIFQTAGGDLDPHLSVIIYICIEGIAAIGAILITDQVGRRPIVLVSTTGCAVGLAVAGLYFFLQDQDTSYVASLGWLPLTALTMYNVFYNIGLDFAPTVYLAELFPTNIKAIAIGLADSFSVLNGALAAKLFQIMLDNQGMFLPFWVFSGCCVVGLVFIIKYVPETKNKTLEEIQLYLIGKTTKDNS